MWIDLGKIFVYYIWQKPPSKTGEKPFVVSRKESRKHPSDLLKTSNNYQQEAETY
jgi:hypothetical protein